MLDTPMIGGRRRPARSRVFPGGQRPAAREQQRGAERERQRPTGMVGDTAGVSLSGRLPGAGSSTIIETVKVVLRTEPFGVLALPPILVL
jgi:hypothetical protein